jgi:hypothetical protein
MTAPVNTLVASANIARTGGLFENLSIGQNLKLQVLRHLEQQRYEVAFGGRRHVVESRVPLQVGTHIEAQVESKGERLELRYLSTDARATRGDAPVTHPSTLPEWLATLAGQFSVALDAQAGATIARAAAQVASPELMTRGGLFLQKLARDVAPRDLNALYRALSGGDSGPVAAAALTQAPIEIDDLPQSDETSANLAGALDSAAREALDGQIAALGDDTNAQDGNEDEARRALRLLNLQDEGSVAWRYGTLPILVAGQLIELDLVMFREREPKAARGGLKRLVMTLDTTHFGRVHVEARAIDNRLLVKLRAPTADAVEVMSAYGAEVRAAIELLGWSVDDVNYEIDPHAGRAAQAVIDHVLAAGSVDREL